jgi:hypothetical protein
MSSWPTRILTMAGAALLVAALILAWNADQRRTVERLAPPVKPPPDAAIPMPSGPDYDQVPTRCARADAVRLTPDEMYRNRPRPELSVRTNEKAGRAIPLHLALIVDKEGRVVCADAVQGFPAFRARAEELAMLWRFKPFKRNGEPIVAQIYARMPIRWRDNRPVKRVPFPQIEDWSTLRISLTRTMCFGTCPNYTVEVAGDGNIRYNGSNFVALRGTHRAKLEQQAIEKLYDQFRRVDFFWLQDGYRAPITDNPAYEIEISFDGHKKRVHDYVGLDVGMPDAVTNLEQAVDDAVDVERWTLGNKNTAPSLVAERWNFRSRSEANLGIVAGLAQYGEPEALRAVIALGAPVTGKSKSQLGFRDHDQTTALNAAVQRDNVEILDIVLHAARWSATDLGDALLEAAAYGRLSVVENLIEAGADPLYTAAPVEQSYDNEWPGSTPSVLMSAARSGIPDVVERILKAGPNVNQRDDHGWTALHYAVRPDWRTYAQDPPERNPRQVVERLIAAGADVNAKTKAGKTPLALRPYDEEVVIALRSAGGH